MSATGTWFIETMTLSKKITFCLEEYFKSEMLYKKPRLIILPDTETKNCIVQIKDDIIGNEDTGVYELITFIHRGEKGLEIDETRIEEVARKIVSKYFNLLY